MSIRNTRAAWGLVQRLAHWTMAGLILFQLALGFWLVRGVGDLSQRFLLTQTHKSWGAVILLLALLRLGWRAAQPRPVSPAGLSRIERLAAAATHRSLYALMLLLPISGWLMACASPLQDAYGLPTMVFGLVTLPDVFQPGSAELEAALRLAHLAAAVALLALIGLHTSAALKHAVVDRDGLLTRMVLGRQLSAPRDGGPWGADPARAPDSDRIGPAHPARRGPSHGAAT